MKTNTRLSLSVSLALAASNAIALPVPRGHDIRPIASSCAIGPFGQTSKAGEYNPHCKSLTDAEKCLALIKRHMNDETGELRSANHDEERVRFCLEEFQRGLLDSL